MIDAATLTGPLHDTLVAAGFEYERTSKGAHGYAHPDGRAALIVQGVHTKEWVLRLPGGEVHKGATPQGLAYKLGSGAEPSVAEVIVDATPIPRVVVETPASRLVSALDGDYNLERLRPESAYSVRIRLLKAMRGPGAKVLAKEATFKAFHAEAWAALEVTSDAAFGLRANELRKAATREEIRARKVEKAKIAAQLKSRPVAPGPVPMPIEHKTNRDRAEDKVALRGELRARANSDDGEPPIARPRPGAAPLEYTPFAAVDPDNGILVLLLEKPNSQGALCVYNNGTRVAAGVATLETVSRNAACCWIRSDRSR